MARGVRPVLASALALLAVSAVACSNGAKTHSSSATTTAVTTATTALPATTTAPAACATTTTAPGSNKGPETNPPGDIPDNQAFVTFSPPAGGWSIKAPEGWARTDAAGGVSFTDKFNAVRVEVHPQANAPTVDSAQALDVPALRTQARCFEAGKVSIVTRKAGQAVLITYRADAAPDPVTGKVVRDDVERYEFWRNGAEAVVTLSGAVSSDNVDPWRLVTDSFTWS